MLSTQEIFRLCECEEKYAERSQYPVLAAYLAIEEKVMTLPESPIREAYKSYVKLIQHYFVGVMECDEVWEGNDESFIYLLRDLPNKLITRNELKLDVPYNLDKDEYRVFLIHINTVWPETVMKLEISNCALYAINNVYHFLTSKYNDVSKRQVIDFELVSPTKSVEPKLHPIALSNSTLMRMVKPGPMLGLLKENEASHKEQHYGLLMSELDIELFKLYMWTGIVGKPNFVYLNKELKDFVNRYSKFFEKATLAPVEFKHLNGARYEPFPHDKALLRDLLEYHIPSF